MALAAAFAPQLPLPAGAALLRALAAAPQPPPGPSTPPAAPGAAEPAVGEGLVEDDGVSAAWAAQAPRAPARRPAVSGQTVKVERLLLDIDESGKKAGSDAELAYATLYTYDHQVEASLVQEMDMVGKELSKLQAMRSNYQRRLKRADDELGQLSKTAPAPEERSSEYAAGTVRSSKDFDGVMLSVQALADFLQRGTVAAATVAGQRPQLQGSQQLVNACRKVRALLAAHQALRPQFPEVFAAFLPVVLVQRQSTAAQKQHTGAQKVRLTRRLRERTAATLRALLGRLRRKRSAALLQLRAGEASSHARQGIEAEEEQRVEELAFSETFTEAVLRIDREFHGKVEESIKAKAELVEAIRNARQNQHKNLRAVIDLLQGRYSVDDSAGPSAAAATPPGAGAATLAGASLLQVAAAEASSLKWEIEAAIRKKEDTHGILLRVKAMLEESAPIEADSVHTVMAELGSALRDAEGGQSKAELAKQKCESQDFHAGREEQGLRANLALMAAVHNHTKAAIRAAKYNLRGIMAKTKALEVSTEDFSQMVSKATAMLEDQSRDRRTIVAAVGKAREIVVVSRAPSGAAAGALLEEVIKDLRAQEVGERAYRSAEATFRGSFLTYARSYLQLLRERRGHYETSLSALELYAEEVENDKAVQAESLGTGTQLRKESGELCADILRFYERHKQRRLELSKALRVVLPEVPVVLGESMVSAAPVPAL